MIAAAESEAGYGPVREPERPDWMSKTFQRADGSFLATVHFCGRDRHPECGPHTFGWRIEYAADVTADEVSRANQMIWAGLAVALDADEN